MTETFSIRQGDLLPFIASVLRDGAGAPIDLSNFEGVTFAMRPLASTTLTVDADAEVDDYEGGAVHYEWAEGDTDLAGPALAEWRLTDGDGRVLTVPNDVPIFVTTTVALEDLPVISVTDLATIRGHIGPAIPPSDADLAVAFGRLGFADAVALEILDARLAVWTDPNRPQRVDIDGDASWQFSDAQITAALETVKRLRGGAAGAPTPLAGGLTYSERDARDPDLVAPYYFEGMFSPPGRDARTG